jgi:hypothetical protein
MPEIYNNSENTAPIEQNLTESTEQRLSSEIIVDKVNNIPDINQTPEQIPTITEQYKAEQHIKQVVETQKNIYQQNSTTKILPPKLQEKYGWLLNVPEEHRVEVAMKLITTKGKDILDVIHAFLAVEDYVALDNLEESLNAIYPTLIAEGILPDIHNK